MFDSVRNPVGDGRALHHSIRHQGVAVTYGDALELLPTDRGFRRFLADTLAEAPFPAFRWETPPVTTATSDRPFEFVLVDAPGFVTRRTDPTAFVAHFAPEGEDEGVVTFDNLSGDATLIVPSPRTEEDAYGHLAAFVRQGPPEQVDAFWQIVGSTMIRKLGPRPVWLNTAGGGVAWLHLRLDSRPKYYRYRPYTRDP